MTTARTDGDETREVDAALEVTAARAEVASAPDSAGAGTLQEGDRIGRYVVTERIGEGGMGVVLRAYDAKLRREVALKIMRPRGAHRSEGADARMEREALALARLSDANVVAVYDTERTEYGFCIAMEYVEGRTLRAWLAERPRPWPEVLEVVLAAARGLAAAHAAGVIHRDVKPDNVLVGHDGRVRLTDFGLAREGPASHEPGIQVSSEDAPAVGGDALATLTQMGTMLGTPPYMAPEQVAGRADEHVDQYALCVVLWEALYGRRPFPGTGMTNLLRAKRAGPPERPRSAEAPPAWVYDVIARGLAVDPAARWPSVAALVKALASGQVRARRRRIAIAVIALVSVVASVALWSRWDRARQIAACASEADTEIAEVYGDAVQAALHEAIASAGTAAAARTADKVQPWLAAQATAWRGARQEMCRAWRVDGTWTKDLHDRGVWCLQERRMELDALVTELQRGEPATIAHAVTAAVSLRPVASCTDPQLLSRLPSPSAQQRGAAKEVRAALARAVALQRVGAYDDGLAAAAQALERAKSLSWPPLVAEARLRRGVLLTHAGRYDQAERVLEEAYFEATEAGAPVLASSAASHLANTVGYLLARHREGLRWARHASTALDSHPDPTGTARTDLIEVTANIRYSMGDEAEAHDGYREVLDRREAALGPDHPLVAKSLGNVAWFVKDPAEARQLVERAIAIRERALGPEHPDVASSIQNLAATYLTEGDYEGARRQGARALEILEAALGPDHPDVAIALVDLANAHWRLGELPKAQQLSRRALVILENSLGPEHPDVAMTLGNIAWLLDDRDEALALLKRTLEVQGRLLGPDHPDLAPNLNSLGLVLAEAGRHAEARVQLERAVALQEKADRRDQSYLAAMLANLAGSLRELGEIDAAQQRAERALQLLRAQYGDDHVGLAPVLAELAENALARGAGDEALRRAERAMALYEATPAAPLPEVAAAQFVLARARWATGRDEADAIALARAARHAYDEAGPRHTGAREEVEAWLKSPS